MLVLIDEDGSGTGHQKPRIIPTSRPGDGIVEIDHVHPR